MFVRQLTDCPLFMAGDATHLRELLHPDKHPLAIRYSLAHAVVPPAETSTPHALQTAEVYYILSGSGVMHIDHDSQPVTVGDAIYIPPQATQFIHNSSDQEPLIFLCIVDPAWRVEDEIIYDRPPQLNE